MFKFGRSGFIVSREWDQNSYQTTLSKAGFIPNVIFV